jgi:NTP pyrophosphatase (non-canonical NTP hydrolase)
MTNRIPTAQTYVTNRDAVPDAPRTDWLALLESNVPFAVIAERIAIALAESRQLDLSVAWERLTFADFAKTNRDRCESPDGFGHPVDGWTLSDWFTAAAGEFGEAANKAKKLNRYRDGIPGNVETKAELEAGLADELADTVIYLDLLAQAAGIDLGTAVVSKFNRTSEKIGAPHRLLSKKGDTDANE